MSVPILSLEKLKVGYPDRVLSSPLDLKLEAGSSLGIVGSNGSGKSTLLRTLLGQVAPVAGTYHWKAGTHFGYVPQKSEIDDLFPFSVLEIMQMGLFPQIPRWGSWSRGLRQAALDMLQKIEMAPMAQRLFRELSGGQKQRVLLGRALMAQAPVLLLDEPFNSLDYGFRENFWKLLQQWQREHQVTLILIEHDINLIINHVDQLVLLGPHQSFVGPKDQILTEETLTRVLETPLHVHQEEDAKLQVHFL